MCVGKDGCQKNFPLNRWGNGEKKKVRTLIIMKLVCGNKRPLNPSVEKDRGGELFFTGRCFVKPLCPLKSLISGFAWPRHVS